MKAARSSISPDRDSAFQWRYAELEEWPKALLAPIFLTSVLLPLDCDCEPVKAQGARWLESTSHHSCRVNPSERQAEESGSAWIVGFHDKVALHSCKLVFRSPSRTPLHLSLKCVAGCQASYKSTAYRSHLGAR